MEKKYQTLGKYDGSMYSKQLYGQPRWEGLEYDWEVPDNLIVGSPGGASTVHHHWTKGFNGRGNTSADIYAGQGERYNSGIYGNLYQTGQEAGQHMGYYPAAPDYQFWQNQEPQQYSHTQSQSSLWAPEMKMYGEPGAYMTDPLKKSSTEGFTPMTGGDDDFELIAPPDEPPKAPLQPVEKAVASASSSGSSDKHVIIATNISIWLIFIFLFMAFIVFDFWSGASRLFIRQHLHGGRSPQWQRAVLYAIIVTLIFCLIVYFAGVPETQIEAV